MAEVKLVGMNLGELRARQFSKEQVELAERIRRAWVEGRIFPPYVERELLVGVGEDDVFEDDMRFR